MSFRLCKRRRFIQLSASLGVELAARLSIVAHQLAAAEINLQHGYAAGEGIRLYYVRAGEGPLMLFLHGFPDDWTLYRPYLLEFRQDHLAVAPNLHGVRPSDQPEEVEAYAMPHLLADLHSVLDHFGRERCILVANDWGAYIAWVFASAYPDRVKRLVIMNGAHPMLLLRDYLNMNDTWDQSLLPTRRTFSPTRLRCQPRSRRQRICQLQISPRHSSRRWRNHP